MSAQILGALDRQKFYCSLFLIFLSKIFFLFEICLNKGFTMKTFGKIGLGIEVCFLFMYRCKIF